MEDLKIVGWTYFDSKYPTKMWNGDELGKIIDLITDEIAAHNYVFSGEEHQCAMHGAPVLSDGTCFRASMRCWAQLMASIYSGADGRELSYMEFYMSLGEKSVMPEYSEIDVEPARVEEQSSGCITKEDRAIINQCLSADMEFVTNDKVLEKLFKKLKKQM